MESQIIVNETDLTPYVVAGSYKVNVKDQYESWRDGNEVEHHSPHIKKVVGEFEIACNSNKLSISSFLAAWNGAVSNDVVSLSLHIPELNELKELSCYFSMSNESHDAKADGGFVDVFKIKVTER